MSHNNHTTDDSIRELTQDGCTLKLLRQMAEGWEDPFPEPIVEKVTLFQYARKRSVIVKVVRDDIPEVGSKGRFGSLLIQRAQADTFVYVAPRVGWAPISLAKLCNMYGKRLILFAPASKAPSDHQRVAMELGADMRFYRVAAMPNLQAKAAEYAKDRGYMFLPLGLRHPLVTAAIVATAEKLAKKHGTPKEVWYAMSTGVLSRGLQLAWPRATHHGVAVARNIKAGERGNATIHSHPQPFTQNITEALAPPFPSARNYDAKVWHFMAGDIGGDWGHGCSDGAWFWNVAGEIQPKKPNAKVRSDVAWGDTRAFGRK